MNITNYAPPQNLVSDLIAQRSFIPNIRICDKNSVVFGSGKIKFGQFYLYNSDANKCVGLGFEDGKNKHGPKYSINCYIGPFRLNVIKIKGQEFIEGSNNPQDEVFQKLWSLFKNKVPLPKGEVIYAGMEHLLHIPASEFKLDTVNDQEYLAELQEAIVNGLTTTFFFSKTNAANAPRDKYPLGSMIKLTNCMVKSSSYSWYVTEESALLDQPQENLSVKYLTQNIEKFVAPTQIVQEIVDAPSVNR